MKKHIIPFILYFIFNFSCLAIGGLVTRPGVESLWYNTISKAPWTPPGFVFGLAWGTIGLTFAMVGSFLYRKDKFLNILYFISWMLNVLWNLRSEEHTSELQSH